MPTPNTSGHSKRSARGTEVQGSIRNSSSNLESPPDEYDGDLVYAMVDDKLTYVGCLPAHDIKL